jgi:hypothetical protein
MSGASLVRLEASTNWISDGVGWLHQNVYCTTFLDLHTGIVLLYEEGADMDCQASVCLLHINIFNRARPGRFIVITSQLESTRCKPWLVSCYVLASTLFHAEYNICSQRGRHQ